MPSRRERGEERREKRAETERKKEKEKEESKEKGEKEDMILLCCLIHISQMIDDAHFSYTYGTSLSVR